MRIEDLDARVCFNGRGDPGIEAEVFVKGGQGRALSPSGASRGKNEALPFVAGNPKLTVRKIKTYRRKLIGTDAADVEGFASILKKVDRTPNYSRIGGSAAYALSVASAAAAADARGEPLCALIDKSSREIPFPLGNVVGGGKHASERSISIQEILVSPLGAKSFSEALTINWIIHRLIGKKLDSRLSYPLGRGDEGAWSPGLTDIEALQVVQEVVSEVQDEAGRQVRIGVDFAADSLYDERNGNYYYRALNKTLDREGQISFVAELADKFHLFYLEDPLQEEDFEGYSRLRSSVNSLVVGDDLYTTNTRRLKKGIEANSTGGVIVKVNQVGTLGEALQFSSTAKGAGQVLIASHRSGDNEDPYLAHFAVGFGCPLMKSGVVGGERTSKLNEVLRLAETLARSRMAHLKVQ
jgi:enolase